MQTLSDNTRHKKGEGGRGNARDLASPRAQLALERQLSLLVGSRREPKHVFKRVRLITRKEVKLERDGGHSLLRECGCVCVYVVFIAVRKYGSETRLIMANSCVTRRD